MNDFTLKTSKGDMLKSMLKSTETAKLLKEALNSPLGSTSRIKAKKIFSIMSKLHAHNEGFGMGGPGTSPEPVSSFGTAPAQVPDFTPKGMVMFNKIPKSNITYGSSPAPKQKTQSQYLNEMMKFNFPAPLPTGISATPSIPTAFRNGVGGPGMSYIRSGMGGPGYDGRGGFFSDVWNGIKTGVSNATGWVGDKLNDIGLNSAGNYMNTVSNYIKPGQTDTSLGDVGSSYWNAATAPFRAAGNAISNLWGGSSTGGGLKVVGGDGSGTYNPNQSWTLGGQQTGWSPSSSVGTSIIDPDNRPGSTTGWALPGSAPAGFTASTQPQTQSSTQQPTNAGFNVPTQDVRATTTTTAQAPSANATPSTGGFQIGTSGMRTDRHNNPTAFTVDIAKQAGLVEGVDYVAGDPFPDNPNLKTARLLGDPIATTIKVIDRIGFTTQGGATRWAYTNSIPGANNADWAKMNTEQKTAVIAQMYAHEGGGGALARTPAQQAVDENVGPATYASQQTEQALGGTYSELMKKNQDALQAKYGIPGQMTAVNKMKEESLNLPQDVTNYIKGRDTYIKETDKEIDRFIDNAMKNTDMSNPENAAKANAQLNYLYTLRGRQNQSYIGYLNSAVEQHTNALNSKIESLNSNIDLYKTELESANKITENEYNLMMQKFADEYTSLKNAPIEEIQKTLLQAQADAALDPMAAIEKKNFLEQGKLLEGTVWTSGKRYVMPGVNLAETVSQIISDPTTGVDPATVVSAFKQGIYNYLEAPNDKDGQTGDGITDASKIETAKYGIKEFNSLATLYQSLGYNTEAKQLLDYADELTDYMVNVEQNKYQSSGQMPNVIEAIKNIDQGRNWLTLGIAKDKPLDESAFVKDFQARTGGTLDESIAKAIYAVYLRYYNDEVNSGRSDTATQEAIKQLLTMTEIDANGNQVQVPVTDATIAKRIAQIVASSQ